MSPETTACCPASALQPAVFNTEAAASSHSAPEPSSRVASPTHAHSSRLRPSSASAAVSSPPHVTQFEQSLGQADYQGSPPVHTATGSGDTSISEGQYLGHGSVSQACEDDCADGTGAAPGQASIVEAVAAAQKQADAGTRQGRLKGAQSCWRCLPACLSAYLLARPPACLLACLPACCLFAMLIPILMPMPMLMLMPILLLMPMLERAKAGKHSPREPCWPSAFYVKCGDHATFLQIWIEP